MSKPALGPAELERLLEIAEPLFASAVAQGMQAPFALDVDYWGRDYGTRLYEQLQDVGLVA